MKKMPFTQEPEFEEGSENVYADIGFPNAEEMLEKSRLVAQIQTVIATLELNPQTAANRIGLSQAELANLLKGHFDQIQQAALLEYLDLLEETSSHRKISPAP